MHAFHHDKAFVTRFELAGSARAGAFHLPGGVAQLFAHLVGEFLDGGHDFGMLVFDVGGFADVVFQIEQGQVDFRLPIADWPAVPASLQTAHGTVLVGEVPLPAAHADGVQGIAPVEEIRLLR